ncbi:MAG: alcohol dehydrogenase catalytic domain-containing protein, partial [Roseiarcus sp.]
PGAVMGHEFVGDVVEVGAAVQRIKRGGHVMASDFVACGHCRSCARGDHWECADRAFFGTGTSFGPALSGGQAELVRVPLADTTLCRVPAGCSDEAAILIGDNLATGWAAVERGGVKPGDFVAVIGGGAVGQLASLSAQAVGAAAVLVVEPNEARRRFAQRHGSLAATPEEAAALLRQIADGDGADVVIEAAGSSGPLRSAFEFVRKRGSIVSVGAHTDHAWPLNLARSFVDELSLTFAIGDSIRLRQRLLPLIKSGVLEPSVVIDARIPFAAAPDAYRSLKAQQIMKAVILPDL